ncbi:restriction endonuclease subunit S [Neolewinella sp.]|uniref:restriction endonuclease subunit S n=1 Tax=Neolewinella sp. TaxID=2993543 RepID=UPI003B51C48A
MKSGRVPEVRFTEFSGEWTEVRLGKTCSEFKSGTGITSSDIYERGEYPVYGGNGLRGYTDTFTHEGYYVLIGRQGALCGNIKEAQGKSFISEHAIAVRSNRENDTKWLSYKLYKWKLNRLSESSAQPGLSVQKLARLKLLVPTLPEQQKIAAFLTAVDRRLRALRRKRELLEAYKRGVMQQMFSGELRFCDKSGKPFPEWQSSSLGTITKYFSKRNKALIDAPIYSVTNGNGFVLQSDYFGKGIDNAALKDYKIVRAGDYAYNPARINVGSIGRMSDPAGLISSLYVCFQPRPKLVDSGFLDYFLQLDSTNHYFNVYGEGGVRVYLWYQLFAGIKLDLPSLPEQRRIASFLRALDDRIVLVERQRVGAEVFKRGLLQKMFV